MRLTSIMIPAGFLIWTTFSSWLTGPVISDSWQSLGPMAGGGSPGHLSGLFLGSFDGFDQFWGHHWPGWPLLRALLLFWVPFRPWIEFLIGALLILGAAASCGLESSGRKCYWLGVSLCLLHPDLHVAISMMRPEPLAALLFVLLGLVVIEGRGGRFAFIVSFCVAWGLTWIHPLGLVLPPSLFSIWYLSSRFSFKPIQSTARTMVGMAIGWLGGALSLSAWFLLNPIRLHQFRASLMAQRDSEHSFWNSARECYGNPQGLIWLCWLLLLAWMVVPAWRRRSQDSRQLHWLSLPLVGAVFSFAVHDPNRIHLACLIPCAVFAITSSAGVMSARQGRIIQVFLLVVVAISATFHLKRALKWMRTSEIPMRMQADSLLKRLSNGARRIYIPCSLWETAAVDGTQNVRFYTLPNVATPAYREASERSLFSDCQVGDLLVFDVTQQQLGSNYFREDALLRLRLVDPATLGPVIEVAKFGDMAGNREFWVIRIDHPPVL